MKKFKKDKRQLRHLLRRITSFSNNDIRKMSYKKLNHFFVLKSFSIVKLLSTKYLTINSDLKATNSRGEVFELPKTNSNNFFSLN